jgi:hypothetical protein
MSTECLVHWNDHDPSPMLIQWGLILQIHRQFHVNWCLVHWNWPWSLRPQH